MELHRAGKYPRVPESMLVCLHEHPDYRAKTSAELLLFSAWNKTSITCCRKTVTSPHHSTIAGGHRNDSDIIIWD